MKIFSTAPDGNEAAELENAHYFNLAIKKIEESNEWMKKTEMVRMGKGYGQLSLIFMDALKNLRARKISYHLGIKGSMMM